MLKTKIRKLHEQISSMEKEHVSMIKEIEEKPDRICTFIRENLKDVNKNFSSKIYKIESENKKQGYFIDKQLVRLMKIAGKENF